MILKSGSLHFEINPGRCKPIAYIRNSYRENGMLSYYLLWHMNRALKPLYKNPEYPAITLNHVIETMKTLQKLKLTVGNITNDTVAEPTEIQQLIQKLVLG